MSLVRNTVIILLSALSLCTRGQETFRYSISGSIYDRSYDGLYVYLEKDAFYSGVPVRIDSTKIKHGKFQFRGKLCELPHLYHIVISDRLRNTQIALEAGQINVRFNKDSEHISGTPVNDLYYEDILIPFHKMISAITPRFKQREEAVKQDTWTTADEIRHTQTSPKEDIEKRINGRLHFIKTYANYPVVEISVFELMVNRFEESKVSGIWERLPEESKKRLEQKIERFRQLLKETKPKEIKEDLPEAVQVGKTFTDFSGETPDGKQITLSELVKNNKLVLIDFWASWCGPCMKEMPVIAGLYKEYKDRGLEILGISSDQSSQRWTSALGKNNMDWLQIRSAGEDPIGTAYGIKYIPYTILIDQNGTIVARRLRGEELQQKIKELLE